ncbi:hypothetical protein [Streptacidiphilus sp. PAMC 29251]
MTDTTITRPAVFRTVDLLEFGGRTVHHVPLDSEVGLRNCWDVRLGVGFDPKISGSVLTFEDDPVVMVVVNAIIPCRFWEDAAQILVRYHQLGYSHPALTPAGHTFWQTWAAMPDAWNDGAL